MLDTKGAHFRHLVGTLARIPIRLYTANGIEYDPSVFPGFFEGSL